MMKSLKILLSILLVTFFAVSCGEKEEPIVFPEGIDVVDTEKGDGERATETDFVEVHYTGYLHDDMTKFDSSLDRNQTFKFQLGAGQVIPGWDQGLQGMRVGGKRTLTIAPELAYGENGAGDVIPPNATLVFEVEMIGITPEPTKWSYDESDLTETETGLKYIIKKDGEGESVKEGDVLTVFYAGFFEDGSMFDTSMRNPMGFRYQLGAGNAIPGWEEGLKGMKKGEERLLILPPDLAYGEEGVGDVIPPNSTLYFNVRIEDVK